MYCPPEFLEPFVFLFLEPASPYKWLGFFSHRSYDRRSTDDRDKYLT